MPVHATLSYARRGNSANQSTVISARIGAVDKVRTICGISSGRGLLVEGWKYFNSVEFFYSEGFSVFELSGEVFDLDLITSFGEAFLAEFWFLAKLHESMYRVNRFKSIYNILINSGNTFQLTSPNTTHCTERSEDDVRIPIKI